MLSSLLATKLYFPPVRPTIVARPRLVERLEAGLQGPFTLVSAPTGFGKTMLLSEWRAGRGQHTQVAWYSLDPADNELVRFFQYLCTALDLIYPGLNNHISPLLQSPTPPSSDVLLTELVNLVETNGQGGVLVLDDYHVIENTSIHEALGLLLNHMPPRLHLVILTRADPALPLARLRAQGQMTEIRTEHLRFTNQEAAEFLNQVMGLALSSQDVAALETRTEGWIAGLQLAALSLRGRQDVDSFVSAFTGSHHYVVDYLAEEVLNRQPEHVRDFLLKTSILERISGSLCDAVTEQSGGQQMLAHLAHANLFLVALDDELRWFRYHHLFGELLRNRLRQLHSASLPELHQRAARWLGQHDLVDEAISHALAAKDYAYARQLFRKDQLQVMYDRSLSCLNQWLKAFPEEEICKDPWMSIARAHVLWATGKPEKVGFYADCAQQALAELVKGGELSEVDPVFICLWGESLAFLSMREMTQGDPEQAVGLAEQATRQLPRYSLSRGFALGSLYVSNARLGRLEQAQAAAQEAVEVSRAVNYPSMHATSAYTLGQYLVMKGQLKQTLQLYRDCLEHAERHGHSKLFYYGLVRVGMADIYTEWNDLELAGQYLNRGLELIRQGGTNIMLPVAFSTAAHLREAQGDLQGALDELDGLMRECRELDDSIYLEDGAVLQLRYQVKLGNPEKAQAWLAKQDLECAIESSPGVGQHYRTIAQLLLLLGHVDEALRLLDKFELYTVKNNARGWLVNVLVMKAAGWKMKDDERRAMECLKQALALGEPENFIRVFVNEGAPLHALLKRAAAQRVAPAYVNKILEAFTANSPVSQQMVGAPTKPSQLLSKRELELLSLIASGRSNKEIAAQLYISLGTVKRHTVNIFNKLDVQNRTEAVAVARELKLL